jgi:parvulin-like peptidyl-prolyl isomerase
MLTTLIVHLIALQLKSKAATFSEPPLPMTRPAPGKVLATVNGTPITAGTVETYLWDWKEDDVLENLINFEVVNVEAKRLHISVSPAELQTDMDQALASVKTSIMQAKQNPRPGADPPSSDVWDALKKQGYTPSRVKMVIRSSALLDKIAGLDFKPSDCVKVSAIRVIATSTKPEDAAAAAKTAQTYYDLLTKGTSWTTVLASSTQDANVLNSQGLIGWRSLSLFPPLAVAELSKMKAGQVTHPITTAYGIQIFRLNAIGTDVPASELKPLKDDFLQKHRGDVLKRLQAQVKIVRIN